MTTSSEWRLWLNGLAFHLSCVMDGLAKMMADEDKLYKEALKKGLSLEETKELHEDHLIFRKKVRRAMLNLKKTQAEFPDSLPLHIVTMEGESK